MEEKTQDCRICGETIPADATVCPHCDCKVDNSGTIVQQKTVENMASPMQQQQSQPTVAVATTSPVSSPAPASAPASVGNPGLELWNPNAAALWSLLFTPIFGSSLMMMTWKAMGNKAEADKSLCWLVVSAVVTLALGLLSDAVAQLSDAVCTGGGILLLLVWYFLSASKQISHVKKEFGETYQRKNRMVPLVIAGGSLVICLFLAALEE